uniref:Coat protein n=1 Tax=Beauveria bassiana victorivirus 3 TaxID=1740649 RepID=A0AA51HPJ9_9VIRU|nr:coat protein [Beauveria bassiana victorivirus 3]
MDKLFTTSFLASVLADIKSGTVTPLREFRRYQATLRSSATIGGNEDSRVSAITYEVGGVFPKASRALAPAPSEATRVDAAYPTSTILSEEFCGLAKKYTNFSATFEYSSLAGVAERLARGLAACSLFDDVDSTALAGGCAPSVRAVNTYDGPINSLVNTVFIPRLVDREVGMDIFCVLVSAVTGEGGSVATDVLELDSTTRRPILGVIEGGSLARALVEALRIVGSNMIASDQGPLFALAVTRGLHRVLTVVGHTDEGGVVRDLLRCGHFGPPFGGIHYSLERYAGIPALATDSPRDIAGYVDALALVTAGVVAHCDPGVVYSGKWFPAFYQGTGPADGDMRPGDHTVGNEGMAARNRSQLLAELPRFARQYMDALGKIFSAQGSLSLSVSVFCSHANALSSKSRHLAYPSITPYFWVEPTSLIPHDFLGSDAEAGGSGALVSPLGVRTKPAWEDARCHPGGDVEYSAHTVAFRNARSAWFLAHWNGHPLNGLGAIRVRQMDASLIIQPGPHPSHPLVVDRLEANSHLGEYLWTRGQSSLCAPGEFLNLGGALAFLVHHHSFDDMGIPTMEHVPNAIEFPGTSVTLSVGRPRGRSAGASNFTESDARRARTRATRELAASAIRVQAFGRPDVAALPLSNTVPVLHPGATAQPERARDHADGGGVSGWTRLPVGGAQPADPNDREARGEEVLPVAHNMAVRYPTLGRQLNAETGGGAAPPQPDGDRDTAEDVPVAPESGAAPPSGPTPA